MDEANGIDGASGPEPYGSPKRLFISHWLQSSDARIMCTSSVLDLRKTYYYVVEISMHPRPGANTEPFPELKENESALLEVEVLSTLIASTLQCRTVEYRPGRGFSAQYFKLVTRESAQQKPLDISIRYSKRPFSDRIYSRMGIIHIGPEEADRPPQDESAEWFQRHPLLPPGVNAEMCAPKGLTGFNMLPVASALEAAAGSDLSAGSETAADSVARLFISHWLSGSDAGVLGMGSVLDRNKTYLYAVAISPEPREGADAEPFSDLQAQESTLVVVEVESDLINGRCERRTVEYRRGHGFGAQYFELATKAAEDGEHGLQVSIVHANRAVYRATFGVRVGQDEADYSAAEPTKQPSAGLLPPLSTPSRLRANLHLGSVLLSVPDLRDVSGTTEAYFNGFLRYQEDARKLMRNQAQKRGVGLIPDKTETEDFFRGMASLGLQTRRFLLGEGDGTLSRTFAQLPSGAELELDTDMPGFPWEWVYEDRRSIEDAGLYTLGLQELISNFWGVRFRLEILPAFDFNRMHLKLWRTRSPEVCVLAAVNSTSDPGRAVVEDLTALDQVDGVRVIRVGKKEDLVKELSKPSVPPHVVYLYCHHRSGGEIGPTGYLRVEDCTMYLQGEDGEELTIKDLRKGGVRRFPEELSPLVVLNACETAQGDSFTPSGFIPYFLTSLNAAAVVGTLEEVPKADARDFGSQLLDRWLRGQPVGTALRDIRRTWLVQTDPPNPVAMFYRLQGPGQVKLLN